ncbi:MAG: OmpA family protein [Gemmatimonadaceae bacterium]|nr:OmpA family protein [Gemmatimonadaceae bacterium]
MPRSSHLLLVAAAAAALAACRRSTPVAAAPEAAPVPSAAPTPPESPGNRSGEPIDEVRQRSADAEREREARAILEAPIHFGFDLAELDAEARLQLDAKLSVLQRHRDVRLRISGHTDERGADEYNLALGQRRAAAVRRHLVQYGLAEGRLEVVSFGEERPLCTESEESCWRRNRRADFEIIAGVLMGTRS